MENKITMSDLNVSHMPTWCKGCGDFNILYSIKTAITEAGLDPDNTLLVSGIGCGSKLPHFIKTYGFEGLHGRGLPVATGAKIANSKLNVITVIGDGDCYGIGGNHFFQIMRRNIDLTLVVQNNGIYGLTKGQYSPTSMKNTVSSSSPFGSIEEPINPIAMGLANGATYIARGYAYEAKHLASLLVNAIKHKGFSMVDVLQPCFSYNKVQSIKWFHERLYKLEDSDYSPDDKTKAWVKSTEWGEKIPIGLFYQESGKETYLDHIPHASKSSLVDQSIKDIDISPFLEKYK